MRLAYLATCFPATTMTFVFNEVRAHDQAGVDLLTMGCAPPPPGQAISQEAKVWLGKTVAPPDSWSRLRAVAKIILGQPRAALANLVWLLGLVWVSPKEFLLGIREFANAAYLAPFCRARGVEHLHVHFASRSLTCGIMLVRFVPMSLSCTVHAFELWGRSGRNLRHRLKHCAVVAAISQYNVTYLRNKCGDDIADRCQVVRCGIDPSAFDLSTRNPVPGRIVLVSGLQEKKGHCYLVEACGILRSRGVPFECLLIGGGPLREPLARQIETLGLGEQVKLLGAVPNDEIRRYLDTAVVFPLPAVVARSGDQDGIPVALMEAMAAGIPVISTNVSGIPELVRDGCSGIVVPPRDAQALAVALERVLTKPDLAKDMVDQGRRLIEEEFDITATSSQLRTLFADVVAQYQASRSQQIASLEKSARTE